MDTFRQQHYQSEERVILDALANLDGLDQSPAWDLTWSQKTTSSGLMLQDFIYFGEGSLN